MSLHILPVERRRSFPPRVTATTEPFWRGLAEGSFRMTCCRACRKFSFPPKPFCPHCWSTDVSLRETSGRGRLYSFTTIHAGPEVFEEELPLHVGIVDLDENVRIACRLHDMGNAAPGDLVRLVVLMFEDGPLFAATPSGHTTQPPD